MEQTSVLEQALANYAQILGDHFTSVFGTLQFVAMRVHPNAKKGHCVVQVQIYPDYQTYLSDDEEPVLGVPSENGAAIWFDADSIYLMKPDDPKFWTTQSAEADIKKIDDMLNKQYGHA